MGRTSDLYLAQPITFESLRRARAQCARPDRVRLLTAQFPEDLPIVPRGFAATPDLTRSVLDLGTFSKPRKLPLLRDILDRLYEASDGCEYLVYTNVDIAVLPNFYDAVDRLIDAGHDALVINRRTISGEYTEVRDLPLLYAQVGQKHPGHDCFIFRRDAYPHYDLGDVCLGMAWVAKSQLLNMAYFSERFRIFEDLHLTFHVGDPRHWENPEFADYCTHNRKAFLAARHRLRDAHGPLPARLKPGVTPPPMFEERLPRHVRLAQKLLPARAYAVAKQICRSFFPARG